MKLNNEYTWNKLKYFLQNWHNCLSLGSIKNSVALQKNLKLKKSEVNVNFLISKTDIK